MKREIFESEIARLLADFPGKDAPEATIQLWWQTFSCLPEPVFRAGINKLILTRNFAGNLPTTGEIAEACVGNHHHMIPSYKRGRGQTITVDQIMLAYREKAEARKQLDFSSREQKALPPANNVEDLKAEVQRLKLRLVGLEAEQDKLENALKFATAQNQYLEQQLAEAERGWRRERGIK